MTEYEMVNLALQRMEYPSIKQYFMAAAPTCFILISSSTILMYAYQAKGTPSLEADAPLLSTILSGLMIFFEIILIAYRNHDQFEVLKTIMEFVLKINIFHLILCASFIPYLKTHGDYTTYVTWIYVCTFPIVLLSGIPFCTDMFVYYS